MELTFRSEGVDLDLEFMEVDENDSNSLRFAANVKLAHPTGAFIYSANDVWLDTNMWDLFESSVINGLEQPARLHDLSYFFEIHIIRGEKKLNLKINIKEPLVSNGEIMLTSTQFLDIDGAFINQLRSSLKSFPKFW